MAWKVVSFLLFFFAFQVVVSGETDERLVSCINKVVEYIKNLQTGKLPSCANKEELEKIQTYIDTFKKFNEGLPEKCKTPPEKQDASFCILELAGLLKEQGPELEMGIINVVKILYSGFRGCAGDAITMMQNSDKHLQEGCQLM